MYIIILKNLLLKKGVDRFTCFTVDLHSISIIVLKIYQHLERYDFLFPDHTENHLVHADYDPANILVQHIQGEWKISAILDWEFAFSGSTLCDVANMLRYAHHMPTEFEEAFIQGLQNGGVQLAENWRITMCLLNLLALLDCLTRSPTDNRPNQCSDFRMVNIPDKILTGRSERVQIICQQMSDEERPKSLFMCSRKRMSSIWFAVNSTLDSNAENDGQGISHSHRKQDFEKDLLEPNQPEQSLFPQNYLEGQFGQLSRWLVLAEACLELHNVPVHLHSILVSSGLFCRICC